MRRNNLPASQAFYEKLGFEQVMGDPTQNWLILRNGTITIGLFQGVFERKTGIPPSTSGSTMINDCAGMPDYTRYLAVR